MASFLDLGLVSGRFGFIFPFLFVFAFVYGALVLTKPFGKDESNGWYGFIGFIFGVMTLFSEVARDAINKMAPWFVLFIVFIFFFLIAIKMFGVKDENILGVLKSDKYEWLTFWIFGIVAVIVVGSIVSAISSHGGIGNVNPGNSSSTDVNNNVNSGNQQSAFWATIAHPKILGLALLFLIGAATVNRMTSQ
jgi:hypothetical protein